MTYNTNLKQANPSMKPVQQPIAEQHSLNCFSMENPVYAELSQALLVADSNQHVYKFMLSKQHEVSLHFDDLQSHSLSQVPHKQSQIESLFKMDVGIPIAKCAIHSFSILSQMQYLFEIIIVMGVEGTLQIWQRNMQQCEKQIKQMSIGQYIVTSIEGDKSLSQVMDYCVCKDQTTNQIRIQILTIQTDENQTQNSFKQIKNKYNVHKLAPQIDKAGMISIQFKKEDKCSRSIVINNEQCAKFIRQNQPQMRLVDRGRMMSVGPWIVGVYDQQCMMLPHIHSITSTDSTLSSMVYSGGKHFGVANRSTEECLAVQAPNDVIAVKYLIADEVVLAITRWPTQAHVYNGSAHLLWCVPLHQIQNPLIVRSDNADVFMVILDTATMKLHVITPTGILKSMPKLSSPIQELKLHQSTSTTLTHRLRIIRTLQSYAANQDYNSVFRFLHNCNNNSMLNDGLMFVYPKLANLQPNLNYQIHLMTLSHQLLQDSKYQSHLENSLTIMLEGCRRQCSANNLKYQAKQWQEYCKLMRQIIESKKMRKLQQQQKNRHLFELSYQLIHTINSQLLRTELKF